MTEKRIHRGKFVRRLVIIMLFLGIAGLFGANYIVKQFGYQNLRDFTSSYFSNVKLAGEADPVEMHILLSDTDFDFMEKKRQEALDRGVQINVGDNYVPCEITVDNDTIEGEIRLKGHMTDHLEGDKWSFRVKSKDEILGMYRFSLQHPGTRNYAYEWVYHQLLKKENIIHLNYDFIHLQLRDKDLGIYALEEHFGQHVLSHNDRPKGAILRWNPGLYWESRIDELQGVYVDEEYSAYSSSFAEPYDKGVVLKDPSLVETYKKGMNLLEGFRRGEVAASDAFDVPKMASFHAVIDLVGGYHSLDWSDVKFFYNSESKKIEPVGYESFSIRKSERIAGQRTPDSYEGMEEDYHDMLFKDSVFFKTYIECLERICDESYFHNFVESIKDEHSKKMGILATEWPHRRFSFDPYYENIELIRHNLELPKPFHAFLAESADSSLNLSIAPVSDFPIELIEIEIDGKEKIEIQNFIIPAKARGTFATYFPISLVHHSKALKNMILRARIPGSSNVFEIEVMEYPSYENNKMSDKTYSSLTSLELHPDLAYNSKDSSYYFTQAAVSISKDYIFSEGILRLFPGQKLSFEDGSLLAVDSEIECVGSTEGEIIITSSSSTESFSLMNCDSHFSNVIFEGGSDVITLFKSKCRMTNCIGADVENTFLRAKFSDVSMKSCRFGRVHRLGEFDRSNINMKEVSATNGKEFILSNGSNIKFYECSISNYELGFRLNHLTLLGMWKCQLDENESIAALNNASEFRTFNCDIGKANTGFILDKEGINVSPSIYSLYKSDQSGVKLVEKK